MIYQTQKWWFSIAMVTWPETSHLGLFPGTLGEVATYHGPKPIHKLNTDPTITKWLGYHHLQIFHDFLGVLIWLVVWNITFIFPFSWEFHHPNWRTPSFFRGVGIPPTSNDCLLFFLQVLGPCHLYAESFKLRVRLQRRRDRDRDLGRWAPMGVDKGFCHPLVEGLSNDNLIIYQYDVSMMFLQW